MRGFEENLGGRTYADSNLMKKGAIYAKIGKSYEDIFHLNHGSHKSIHVEGEILPQNVRTESVNDFLSTRNKESWGWKDYELNCNII